MEQTLKSRLEERFTKLGEDECWLWQGSLDKKGRGRIRVNGRLDRPHRISYLIYEGPIPEGKCVCHRCDVPACVNPNHLFLGTKGENNTDRNKKGRTRTGDFRGEKGPAAKLTEEQVLEIRRLYPKLSQSQLAQKFGVCQMTISWIVRRKRWAHI